MGEDTFAYIGTSTIDRQRRAEDKAEAIATARRGLESYAAGPVVIDKKAIIADAIARGVMLSDFIDYVIEINGFIGVGIITLADDVRNYMLSKIK